MVDVGENIEYVKTIINNSIELKKIEGAELSSKFLGIGILGIVLGIMTMFVLGIIIIISSLLLIQHSGSTISGLLIMLGIISFIMLIIYIFRKKVIYTPIANAIMSSILD